MNAEPTNPDGLGRAQQLNPPRTVAVIDIGSTSLRMQVAEIQDDGSIRKLEEFSQAVSLGKDTFITGRIERQTIEDCVHVLQLYRSKLDEYGITGKEQIRVIATSGIKEAVNSLAMQDRIYIATGFEIEPFDAAELHRVTFLGIQPLITTQPELFSGQSVACEVGGGTTELLVLRKSDVIYSQTFRLGAMRLRKTLEALDLPTNMSREIMEAQILQTIDQLREEVSQPADCYVAMGSDIRFAAQEIKHHKLDEHLVEVDLNELDAFVTQTLKLSPDRIVARYHFSQPDAESFGPGLLAHVLIAQTVGAKRFLVANVNLRDALLQEMAAGRRWSDAIQNQIIQSAKQLGRKFHYQQKHAEHVAKLAWTLFDQLKPLHRMDDRYRGILELAALLHEIGLFVGSRSNHKHSMYLIRNSELFGVGARDMELVALVARYHRRATPQPVHEGYAQLNREERVAVSKLAALLRVAIALDASRAQRISEIDCQLSGGGKRVVITAKSAADLSMEQLKLKQVRGFFESIFGAETILKTKLDS